MFHIAKLFTFAGLITVGLVVSKASAAGLSQISF